MNLWFSHLLVAGLVLTTSALTPEECQPLIKPLSLADVLHGKLHFIMGYTDTDAYNAILKITESYWMKITPSPSDKSEVYVHEENKINGSCIGLSLNMTIDGEHVKMSRFCPDESTSQQTENTDLTSVVTDEKFSKLIEKILGSEDLMKEMVDGLISSVTELTEN